MKETVFDQRLYDQLEDGVFDAHYNLNQALDQLKAEGFNTDLETIELITKEEDSFKEDQKKVKKVNPFEESVDTLQDRMNQYLLKDMKPKNLNDKEKDDLIEDLMNMFFKDDIDNSLDDDIIK